MKRIVCVPRLAAALFMTTALLTVGGPAVAEDSAAARGPEVGVSLDGVHYEAGITQPLFDPKLRWVPGDERSSRFWVRNQAVDPGDLTIDLLTQNRQDLFDSSYLSISARAGVGPWHTVTAGTPMRLIRTTDFPAKAEVPVTVLVAVAAEAPNTTMVLATDLDFRITLTDARATGPNVTDGPGGLLPSTGAAASWWVVPLGLLLLLAGTFLLGRRHRFDPPLVDPYVSGESR